MCTRRALLEQLAGTCAALAAAGCVPRVVTAPLLRREPALEEAVALAFLDTIVPGLDDTSRQAARVLADPELPFAPYGRELVLRLCDRGLRLWDEPRFDRLDEAQRVGVVEALLAAGGISGKLVSAGILVVQTAALAGIYDDAHGCPLIGFEATRRPLEPTLGAWPPEVLALAWGDDDGNPP